MNKKKWTDINLVTEFNNTITLIFDNLIITKNIYNIFLGSKKYNIGSFISYELFNEIIKDIKEFNYFVLVIDNKEVKFNFKYIIEGVYFGSES